MSIQNMHMKFYWHNRILTCFMGLTCLFRSWITAIKLFSFTSVNTIHHIWSRVSNVSQLDEVREAAGLFISFHVLSFWWENMRLCRNWWHWPCGTCPGCARWQTRASQLSGCCAHKTLQVEYFWTLHLYFSLLGRFIAAWNYNYALVCSVDWAFLVEELKYQWGPCDEMKARLLVSFTVFLKKIWCLRVCRWAWERAGHMKPLTHPALPIPSSLCALWPCCVSVVCK